MNGTSLNKKLFTFSELTTLDTLFLIESEDMDFLGFYEIQFSTVINSQTYSSTFIVEMICKIDSLFYTLVEDQIYIIEEDPLFFDFAEYQRNPNCDYNIEYKAELSDGQKLPLFISFNPKEREFKVYSESKRDKKHYELKVLASVTNADSTVVSNNARIIILDVLTPETVYQNLTDEDPSSSVSSSSAVETYTPEVIVSSSLTASIVSIT
mmetsp:Transcript_29180/g.28237  ORF Transcript_29180/g.28237 Transcript_29180/m.28237 type:complete len:210 (-) Transcript_29180:84-713(-)